MSDERLHVPVEREYVAALGLAVYCFASLEWNAIRCCERLEPGSIEALEDRTAGRVADTLVHLAKRLGNSAQGLSLQEAAADFRFLVGTRNNLVHSKPGTAADGSPRLLRHGDPWTVSELESVADAFAACGRTLEEALQSLK